MKPFDIKSFDPKSGITLIEASAGTGKTYSITEIVAGIIESGQCKIDEILLLTFTNPATAELKDRIRKKLHDAHENAVNSQDSHKCETLAQAMDQFDNSVIQTIHGFCQRILHEFSVECGLPVEFEVLRETSEFDAEIRHSIIRTIQSQAEEHPVLIPFSDWLGFNNGYERAIANSRDLRAGISQLTSFKDPYHEINRYLKDLAAIWAKEREMIRAYFHDPKACGIRKVSPFKLEEVDAAFSQFDTWVDKGILTSKVLTSIENFTPANLGGCLKKNKEVPEYEFFEVCGLFRTVTNDLLYQVLKTIDHCTQTHEKNLNEKQQKLRYDDLLVRLMSSLQSNPSLCNKLRKRFRFGLIDEFQDTDPVQFQILKHLFIEPLSVPFEEAIEPRPLILIGDPKQAIYSFRGGDIFTYESAKKASYQQYFLSTNYRSAPAINAGVNALLTRDDHAPFIFDWLEYEPVQTAEEKKSLAVFDQNQQNQSGIHFQMLRRSDFTPKSKITYHAVNETLRLLNEGYTLTDPKTKELRAVEQSDIAILVPSNQQGAELHKELSKRGLQAVISSGASVFESDEANDWYRILLAILNPKNTRFVKAALATAPFSFSAADIHGLESNPNQWNQLSFAFQATSETWIHGHFGRAISSLSKRFHWEQNLGNTHDALRALSNHHHLLELLLKAQFTNHYQASELFAWFEERIESPNSNNEEELLRLERDSKAINILTMHKSKGLQFPIVLLPFAFEVSEKRDLHPPFTYHDPSNQKQTVYSQHQLSTAAKRAKTNEVLSEKLRLLYVAVTRAEHMCIVFVDDKPSEVDPVKYWLNAQNRDHSAKAYHQEDAAPSTQASEHPADVGPTQTIPQLIPPQMPPAAPLGTASWSFSGIIHNQNENIEAGSDEINLTANSIALPVDPTLVNIHAFEKGTHAGLFFHSILEDIDFQYPSTWSTCIQSTLGRYGYSCDQWTAPLMELMEHISAISIQSDNGITYLGTLPSKRLFRETEFTFPMQFDYDRYSKLKKNFETESCRLPILDTKAQRVEGYLKGVIDMWFEANGKIYLLDWKSNWLGEDTSAYTQEALVNAMNEHQYHLQYLLYLCALNRYLKLMRPDFDYNRDFGGVYYVFIRGLSDESNQQGIFYNKPSLELITQLDECFRR